MKRARQSPRIGFGIYADSYSSGNISILTSNNDVIDSTAGGEAIFAINNALAVPIGSTINVTARGNDPIGRENVSWIYSRRCRNCRRV